MIKLGGARLRSNPRLRLVAYDRLDPASQRAFASLCADPGFYGILAASDGDGLPPKSVSREAALLFYTLREPAAVPHLLATLLGDRAEERLAQLVLDGVFEVEQEAGFVSGAAALPALRGQAAAPAGHLAHLADEAIAYAAALGELPLTRLAARIYMFNRMPCTPRRQRELGAGDQLLARLADGATAARLQRWHRHDSGPWITWRAAETPRLEFKLYVSPAVDDLVPCFRLAVASFAQVGCPAFKIGGDPFALTRPDKLVAYFADLEHLHAAAESIRASSASMAPQGVPFTAAIDPDGLLSWGMDPPRLAQVMPWQTHQSWRQWVAERIAVYVVAARGTDAVARFVRARLSLDGVDPVTWTPNLAIWREPS